MRKRANLLLENLEDRTAPSAVPLGGEALAANVLGNNNTQAGDTSSGRGTVRGIVSSTRAAITTTTSGIVEARGLRELDSTPISSDTVADGAGTGVAVEKTPTSGDNVPTNTFGSRVLVNTASNQTLEAISLANNSAVRGISIPVTGRLNILGGDSTSVQQLSIAMGQNQVQQQTVTAPTTPPAQLALGNLLAQNRLMGQYSNPLYGASAYTPLSSGRSVIPISGPGDPSLMGTPSTSTSGTVTTTPGDQPTEQPPANTTPTTPQTPQQNQPNTSAPPANPQQDQTPAGVPQQNKSPEKQQDSPLALVPPRLDPALASVSAAEVASEVALATAMNQALAASAPPSESPASVARSEGNHDEGNQQTVAFSNEQSPNQDQLPPNAVTEHTPAQDPREENASPKPPSALVATAPERNERPSVVARTSAHVPVAPGANLLLPELEEGHALQQQVVAEAHLANGSLNLRNALFVLVGTGLSIFGSRPEPGARRSTEQRQYRRRLSLDRI